MRKPSHTKKDQNPQTERPVLRNQPTRKPWQDAILSDPLLQFLSAMLSAARTFLPSKCVPYTLFLPITAVVATSFVHIVLFVLLIHAPKAATSAIMIWLFGLTLPGEMIIAVGIVFLMSQDFMLLRRRSINPLLAGLGTATTSTHVHPSTWASPLPGTVPVPASSFSAHDPLGVDSDNESD